MHSRARIAFLGMKMIARHQSLLRRVLLRSAAPTESAALAQRNFSSSTVPPADGDGTTHFGFQQVREEEKKPMVASVFHKVAERYVLLRCVSLLGAPLHTFVHC